MGFAPGALEKRAISENAASDAKAPSLTGQTQIAALRELSEPIKSMFCSSIALIDKENVISAAIA